MWFEIPDMDDGQQQPATGVLICAVYVLHPKYPVEERQRLWEYIWASYELVTRKPQYSG